MKHIILFFVAVVLIPGNPCMAKGHGGGHGGRGGGGHSYRSPGSYSGSASRTTPGTAAHIAPAHAATDPGPGRVVHTPTQTMVPGGGKPGATGYNGGYYGGYYPPEYYNPYYAYNPFYYDPFYMAFGTSIMVSPHYNYVDQPANNNDEEPISNMPGYVVYNDDTLKGKVSIGNRAVEVLTKDEKQSYDYVYSYKKEGLRYITIYNTDSSQLNLVRMNDESGLIRVVHEGKLNIYDGRHKFIYHPEDIDVRSLYVVYNGQGNYLNAVSTEDAKIRLTQYVNKAYGLNLDSKNYTWKALLVYVDKLD